MIIHITVDVIITGHDWMPRAKRWKKLTFEWRGPENGVVGVSKELLDMEPDLLSKLPWKLKKVGESEPWEPPTFYYMREEYVNHS